MLNPLPYAVFAVDRGEHVSPDGTCWVRVVINDAGAMHSGNHWMFIARYHWSTGYRIVSAGYVAGSRDPLPMKWIDSKVLRIEYLMDRRIESRDQPSRADIVRLE